MNGLFFGKNIMITIDVTCYLELRYVLEMVFDTLGDDAF